LFLLLLLTTSPTLAETSYAGKVVSAPVRSTMPLELGLDIPDWDDGSASVPAPAKLKLKAQPVSQSKKDKQKGQPAEQPAAKAAALVKKKGNATQKTLVKGTPTAPAFGGKASEAHGSPAVSDGNESGMKRKRKKRKGKHSKNKDTRGELLSADMDPAFKGQTHEQAQKKKPGQQLQPAAQNDRGDVPQQHNNTTTHKPKKRKRKNKFREAHDDADAAEAGGRWGVERVEQSHKKQKLDAPKPVDAAKPVGPGAKRQNGNNDAARKLAENAAGKGKGKGKGETGIAEARQDWDADKGKVGQGVETKFPFKSMGQVASNRKLTPLQAKLAAKLQGAHFRMLNEELYTTPSSSAVRAPSVCLCVLERACDLSHMCDVLPSLIF
jgi:hypothetical protein